MYIDRNVHVCTQCREGSERRVRETVVLHCVDVLVCVYLCCVFEECMYNNGSCLICIPIFWLLCLYPLSHSFLFYYLSCCICVCAYISLCVCVPMYVCVLVCVWVYVCCMYVFLIVVSLSLLVVIVVVVIVIVAVAVPIVC